jgi:hypothetical protein
VGEDYKEYEINSAGAIFNKTKQCLSFADDAVISETCSETYCIYCAQRTFQVNGIIYLQSVYVRNNNVFRHTMTPCKLVDIYQSFEGKGCSPFNQRFGVNYYSSFSNFSALKMEAIIKLEDLTSRRENSSCSSP